MMGVASSGVAGRVDSRRMVLPDDVGRGLSAAGALPAVPALNNPLTARPDHRRLPHVMVSDRTEGDAARHPDLGAARVGFLRHRPARKSRPVGDAHHMAGMDEGGLEVLRGEPSGVIPGLAGVGGEEGVALLGVAADVVVAPGLKISALLG